MRGGERRKKGGIGERKERRRGRGGEKVSTRSLLKRGTGREGSDAVSSVGVIRVELMPKN